MAKKVFTLAPNIYFGKQLAKGGKKLNSMDISR